MIHYKDGRMSRVGCLAVSAQASSDRPAAVDCPACKATSVHQAAFARHLTALALPLATQGDSPGGTGTPDGATELSACLPGIVKDDRR